MGSNLALFGRGPAGIAGSRGRVRRPRADLQSANHY
jgi:hypothetical protein